MPSTDATQWNDGTRRRLHLNTFGIGYGFHMAAWQHPSVDPLQSWDIEHQVRSAKIAERGFFDSIFIPDGQGMSGEDPTVGGSGETRPEPLTVLSAISSRTEHIGLGATFSTTYNEPFNIARFVASLDVLSGGRAGWNIVTSQKALDAQNFGEPDLPSREERYRRSEEFVEVVKGLWATWDAGAIVGDTATGRLVDRTKIHRLDHVGEYFSVRGPLNVPRSPQGRPILFQAGSSEVGKDQGARHGDVLFTAQTQLDTSQAFYRDVRSRAERFGRNPDHIRVVPGLLPVLGSTEREAQDIVDDLAERLDIGTATSFWRGFTGIDLAGVDLDAPIPEGTWDAAADGNFASRVAVLRERALRESLTARQLIQKASLGVGHKTVVGTPEQVADVLESWFVERAADGFNILSLLSPLSIETFVDHVVPLLQARGIYTDEYQGTTLREHYGLPLP